MRACLFLTLRDLRGSTKHLYSMRKTHRLPLPWLALGFKRWSGYNLFLPRLCWDISQSFRACWLAGCLFDKKPSPLPDCWVHSEFCYFDVLKYSVRYTLKLLFWFSMLDPLKKAASFNSIINPSVQELAKTVSIIALATFSSYDKILNLNPPHVARY